VNKQIQITDAEWEVMKVLWLSPGLTANEVSDSLSHTQWHLKTVRTMLDRLQKKDMLDAKVMDRLYRYTPLVTREECIEEASTTFLSRVFDGALTPLVTHFVKNAPMSKKDKAELERILDKYKED
jgi:BlaI family penicillinase repressor